MLKKFSIKSKNFEIRLYYINQLKFIFMKKAILLGAVFLTFGQAFAASWTITTSCGTKVTKEFADNVTVSQLEQAVSQINLNECGVRPSKVTITL